MSVTSEHAGCTLLVVDADPARLARTVTVLSQAGYACASATSVADARAATADRSPDLLITDVRVGAGLGVDLVLQRYLSHRRSVMVDTQFRQELAVDASRLDAVYLVHPVKPQRLLQAVTDQLRQQRGDERRRWPRAALRSGVQIAVDGTQATLTDVSYGGFRIAIAAGATDRGPPCVTIRLAPLTQTVRGRLAWQTATGGGLACGLTLGDSEPASQTAWRQWVDQVAV